MERMYLALSTESLVREFYGERKIYSQQQGTSLGSLMENVHCWHRESSWKCYMATIIRVKTKSALGGD